MRPVIRLMGALLTVGAGTFLGLEAGRRLRRRARVLRQLAGALEQMDREISFRLTPMPRLMEQLANDCPAPVGTFFANCRRGMEDLGERSLAEIWRQALADTPLDLEGRAAGILDELGDVLGRFEESGLRTALARAGAELAREEELAREDGKKRGRMYQVLGLTSSALLVILLL